MSAPATDRLLIRTPEGAVFSFRLAGPVLRLLAFLVDLAVVGAASTTLAVFVRLFQLISPDVYGLVAAVAYFLLSQGYFVAMEWWAHGQTLGKRLLRLRVVDATGLRLQFSQIMIRNVLRLAEGLPPFWLAAAGSMLITRKSQRLGDLAAATVVVWERGDSRPDFTLVDAEKFNSLRGHPASAARLRQAISPAEAAVAARALVRRERLADAARLSLFAEIALRFKAAGMLPPEATDGISDEQLVRNVVEILYAKGPGR